MGLVQVDYSKNLIDDEAFDGATPQLPVLGSAQWQLLLECPCFTRCSGLPALSRPASASAGGHLYAAGTCLLHPTSLSLANQHALYAVWPRHCRSTVEAASCKCIVIAGAVAPLPPPLVQQAETLLAELKRWHAQSSIDGHGNIWILKPGSKSRGRGIFCTNNMKEVKVRSCCSQARCW